MTWTHGMVGLIVACSMTAHAARAASDIPCDRSQRTFVARSFIDDDAQLMIVQPQRLAFVPIDIEAVDATRIVFAVLTERRAAWDTLQSLVLTTTPWSILDVAANVADLVRAFADDRTPPKSKGLAIQLTNVDGTLYTQWSAADIAGPGLRLLRVAPGYRLHVVADRK